MIREYTENDYKSIDEIGKLIKRDFNQQMGIERLNNKFANIYIYEERGEVIGFLHFENHYEITDILNIAVRRENQNKKIGERLINYLVQNTKAEKLILEVRENNRQAIAFYKKMNFKKISIRKKYYGEEDAIIMERRLS